MGETGDRGRIIAIGIEYQTKSGLLKVGCPGELIGGEWPHQNRNTGRKRLGNGVVTPMAYH